MAEYHRLPVEDTLSGPAMHALVEAIDEYLCISNVSAQVSCELENLRNLCRSTLDHKAAGVWEDTPALDPLLG